MHFSYSHSVNMLFNQSIRVLFLAVVLVQGSLDFRPKSFKKYTESCSKLAKNPYYDTELLVGKSWRIYYSWNMKLQDKCLDMTFRNSTPAIVSRIYNDMYEYLESQPYWDAATLLVTMGQSRHEMLLFADQGAAGNFIGVPNVVRDGNISPNKNAVPLFKIHLKMLDEGKYLIMSDCNIGVSTLSVHRDQRFSRREIEETAGTLDLGEGFSACVSDVLTTDMDVVSTAMP